MTRSCDMEHYVITLGTVVNTGMCSSGGSTPQPLTFCFNVFEIALSAKKLIDIYNGFDNRSEMKIQKAMLCCLSRTANVYWPQ